MSGNALPSLALLPAHGPATAVSLREGLAFAREIYDKAKTSASDKTSELWTVLRKYGTDLLTLFNELKQEGLSEDIKGKLRTFVETASGEKNAEAALRRLETVFAKHARFKPSAVLGSGAVATGNCYVDDRGRPVYNPPMSCIAFEVILDVVLCVLIGRCSD